MPELPEVETTRRGIAPNLLGKCIAEVNVYQKQLRWPIPNVIKKCLPGKNLLDIDRRGKYLLLKFANGTLLIHLGMSGRLRITTPDVTRAKHDHVDIIFTDKQCLRFTDPRRFGAMLWHDVNEQPLMQHKLLKKLGPEPLSQDFTDTHLWERSRKRTQAVKLFIMDSHIVVGVGNIYANEALFQAGIHPNRAAGRISQARYLLLTKAIRKVLKAAIKQGGTTLKDFTSSDGSPGYFKQELQVYGRKDLPCVKCASILKELRLGGRSSVYCPHCQR